jgi:Protein of unknown function (DUF2281)
MDTAEAIYELVKIMPEEQAVVVLRLAEALQEKGADQLPQERSLLDFFGILKGSPSFEGDPVEIQRRLRSEW